MSWLSKAFGKGKKKGSNALKDNWFTNNVLNPVHDYLTGETQAAINTQYALEQMSAQYGYNSALQESANAFSAAEADKARQWEAQMSNTAYQRARADLQAANLNPLLALMQGGASTPSVPAPHSAVASVAAPTTAGATGHLGEVINTIGSFASGAGALATIGAKVKSALLDNESKEAQIANVKADTIKKVNEGKISAPLARASGIIDGLAGSGETTAKSIWSSAKNWLHDHGEMVGESIGESVGKLMPRGKGAAITKLAKQAATNTAREVSEASKPQSPGTYYDRHPDSVNESVKRDIEDMFESQYPKRIRDPERPPRPRHSQNHTIWYR